MLTWKKRLSKSDPDAQPRDPAGGSGWDLIFVSRMLHELTETHAAQKKAELQMRDALARIPEGHRASARNLIHYLALRSRDVRTLQESLASLGLSSLGRAEGHILHNVEVLLKHLHHMVRHTWQVPADADRAVTRHESRKLLERRAAKLLGGKPKSRSTRIMVTMPSEAGTDEAFVKDLVAAGMDCMRINCAHDGPALWQGMIDHLRRAEKELGRSCTILMDLGGPKIRSGAMEPGPKVIKWKPTRDEFGRTKEPAQIWLTPAEDPKPAPAGATATLPVRRAWLARLAMGDVVRFRDLRKTRRTMEIGEGDAEGRWALSAQTAYVEPGTVLVREAAPEDPEPIGDLPSLPQVLTLRKGDRLLLTRAPDPGRPGEPARISCTLPEALADVHPGDPVRFDDGKIDARVQESTSEGLLLEITRTPPRCGKLGADKGINFPGSALSTPSLTPKDLEDLVFVAAHADMVGYSFVRTPEEVRDLRRRLTELGGRGVGIVLKIETQASFEHLPDLLLAALEGSSTGVMIARGDLAIECGYERLAELQEEILWLCEAAHLPAIWATQVLEHLAKDGQPSRAEVTDAAMGVRAECVMLNKGPHVLDAVRTLDDIIRRMEAHLNKKTPTFRPLRVAREALHAGN